MPLPIQYVPALADKARPETGPMRFGDDWTGLFIRGDNALMGYLPAIGKVLVDLQARRQASPEAHGFDMFQEVQLRGLYDLLASCAEGPAATIVPPLPTV